MALAIHLSNALVRWVLPESRLSTADLPWLGA
jgi:hypothetical protein